MDGEVRNGGTLQRIAALLLSLALVAERAAGRSRPVRFLVLVVLRRAKAVATSFVVREIEAAGADAADFPWLDEAAESGSSPLDAAWLALRFRLLAEVLDLCRAAHRSGNISRNISGDQARSGDMIGDTAINSGGNSARHPATQFPILLLLFPATRGLPVHDTS
jgi:hypothetical protein